MNHTKFMFIAGEASGDLLAAELVMTLKEMPQVRAAVFPPEFFGAGGEWMAAAGVELAFNLTQHAVIGMSDVLKNYCKFRRLFHQLLQLAIERQPDVIVCVDFSGFNRRFAHAVRQYVRSRSSFCNWNPRIVQYVSPQVWASRPDRAYQLEEDLDLLLSIFPFEKDWYAAHTPKLRVEFVGHPLVERFDNLEKKGAGSPLLLLPGSRKAELERHLPLMLEALKLLKIDAPNIRARMVLPDAALAEQARRIGVPADLEIQISDLPAALAGADVAIASTGTVTMECAFYGVPTVALYKTSWLTYQIGKRIVTVKHLAMPNLLAGEEIFPEFIQAAATPQAVSNAAFDLLCDEARRGRIKMKLSEVVAALGGPGANRRAAAAILGLLDTRG
jgi:lipid-A-disaccharide synthase